MRRHSAKCMAHGEKSITIGMGHRACGQRIKPGALWALSKKYMFEESTEEQPAVDAQRLGGLDHAGHAVTAASSIRVIALYSFGTDWLAA